MLKTSLLDTLEYGDQKPKIKLLMESETAKEIRIVFRKGQIMKEHKTVFPITVEIFEGAIDFGIEGKVYSLVKGDIVTLPPSISHDLTALTDSIVRLTLAKSDSVKRVESVVTF